MEEGKEKRETKWKRSEKEKQRVAEGYVEILGEKVEEKTVDGEGKRVEEDSRSVPKGRVTCCGARILALYPSSSRTAHPSHGHASLRTLVHPGTLRLRLSRVKPSTCRLRLARR